MNQRSKGIVLAVTTAVMWGIMGIFVRDLSHNQFTNIEISFFRCALAGAAYFIFLLLTKPSALKVNIKGLVICVLYGAVAYSISFVSYSVSVSRIPVGVATVLMFMSPIWVVILGTVMFKEKLQKSKIVTIVICFIGAILVANLIGGGEIKLDAIGILAGIINGIGVALQILLPKFFAKEYERYVTCLWIFGSSICTAFWNGFRFGCRTYFKYANDKFNMGFIWNWNFMYNGGKCSLCKIYTVCGGFDNKYSFCTGSCSRNTCRIFYFP